MEEVNRLETCGAHSDDDKVHPDKNKKRRVKTRPQVEALERFFDEHKYPSESMKIELADSIGLTEKQVSGWFCHRRSKDKKLQNVEKTCLIERQDRSSGVIQDRGSGQRQDSCGSTKQEDNQNSDTREVESSRLNHQKLSPSNLNCQNEASGSGSSIRTVPSNDSGDPFVIPTSPVEVKRYKARFGPAGYLKVKGQTENSAITSVKRRLSKHYIEDGPPLSIDFDPPPPGAFESPMQNETCDSGEPRYPMSTDVSKVQKYLRIREELEYGSAIASFNSDVDRAKMAHRSGNPVNHVHRKFAQKMSLSDNVPYYNTGRSPESIDEYTNKSREIESYCQFQPYGMKVEEVSCLNPHRSQPYGGKKDEERTKSRVYGQNRFSPKMSKREDFEKRLPYMAVKRNGYDNLEDKEWEHYKDGKYYEEFRERNVNFELDQAKMLKNEMPASKRMRIESTTCFRSTKLETPSNSSEDEESAETNSSVD